MSNETATAPAPVDTTEIWKNTGRGLLIIKKLNGADDYDVPIQGGGEVVVTPADRRFMTEKCVRGLNPYANGQLAPVNDAAIEAYRILVHAAQTEPTNPWSSSGVASPSPTGARPPGPGTAPGDDRVAALETKVEGLQGDIAKILAAVTGQAPPVEPAMGVPPGDNIGGYQVFDETADALVDAPEASGPPKQVTYHNLVTDADRETVASGPQDAAMAFLSTITSPVVMEQLYDWARSNGATRARMQLIGRYLLHLNPDARIPVQVESGTGGAPEPGPQGMTDPNELDGPQGMDASFLEGSPQEGVLPGEGKIYDDGDSARFVPGGLADDDPRPQTPPGLIIEPD